MKKPCICTLCDTAFTLKRELVDHVLLQHTGEKPHQPNSRNSYATVSGQEQMDYSEKNSSPDVCYRDQNFSMKHNAKNRYSLSDTNNLDVPKEELVGYINISPTFDKENGKEDFEQTQAHSKFELNYSKDNVEVIAKLLTNRQLTQLRSLELPIIKSFGEQQSRDVFEDVKKDGVTESREYANKFKRQGEIEVPGVTDNSRIFVCGMCNKVFKEECELQSHTLTHNTADWFKCTKCEKTFSGKYYLLKHKRTCGYKISANQNGELARKTSRISGSMCSK